MAETPLPRTGKAAGFILPSLRHGCTSGQRRESKPLRAGFPLQPPSGRRRGVPPKGPFPSGHRASRGWPGWEMAASHWTAQRNLTGCDWNPGPAFGPHCASTISLDLITALKESAAQKQSSVTPSWCLFSKARQYQHVGNKIQK